MNESEGDLHICTYCGTVFEARGDDWYEVNRMHDDRIGEGTWAFCRRACAITFLALQSDLKRETVSV